MIKYLIVFPAALLLQAVFVRYIEIVHWKPDLVLIALVIFSIDYGRNYGSSAGFLLGLASDLISSGLLGLGALSKAITGFTAGVSAGFFEERSQFLFTLLISGFVQDLIYYYINTLGRDVVWRVVLFVHIIPNLFYTAIVGTVIYYFLGKWLKEHGSS